MQCKFENICKTIYENNFKEVCMFYNNSTNCQLAVDIKNDNLNTFVKSLLKRESKIDESEELNEEKVMCPRSLTSNVVLRKNCPITDCTFNSRYLLYNCFLIHHNIVFPDHYQIPESLIINGLKVTKQDYHRMLRLGIYMSRIHVLMKKYVIDLNNQKNKFKSKEIRKLFKNNRLQNICSICSAKMVNNNCDCLKYSSVRKERIKFSKKWRRVIENKESLNIDNMEVKKFQKEYKQDMNKLSFIRSLLKTTQYSSISFYQLPFGYIFSTFNEEFEDSKDKKAENIGLTENLYDKAEELFKVR